LAVLRDTMVILLLPFSTRIAATIPLVATTGCVTEAGRATIGRRAAAGYSADAAAGHSAHVTAAHAAGHSTGNRYVRPTCTAPYLDSTVCHERTV
jgi:hypothetical protein